MLRRSPVLPRRSLQTPVSEARQRSPYLREDVRIEDRDPDPITLCATLGNYSTPGIHDHRMAIGRAVAVVLPPLSRCKQVTLKFDGTGAKQYVPMVSPGTGSERRRYREQGSSLVDEAPIEFRKSEVSDGFESPCELIVAAGMKSQ